MFNKTLVLIFISLSLLVSLPASVQSSNNFFVDAPKSIEIQKINLKSPIQVVEGKPGNWPVPENVPATASERSRVGGRNNISIWGHRSMIFKRLGELGIGDEIKVEDNKGVFVYKIARIEVITPGSKDYLIMAKTDDFRLTLITCNPMGSTSQRLIITATLL